MPKITKETKEIRDLEAVMAVYIGGRPFNTYENKYMERFIINASQNTYTPPFKRLIGGQLLTECYTYVKSQVDQQIARVTNLNFICDESTDISNNRVINLSIVIPPFGSFFLENIPVNDDKLDSDYLVDWFFNAIHPWVGDDYSRVNSITTDTCNTMRSFWKKLEKDPRLAHAFFILCDSYGLQLLIKDLLKVPLFKDIHRKCKAIAKGLRKAKKQYAILRTKQKQCYNERRALALSILTRWGSQAGMIKSVLWNKEALKLWAIDSRATLKSKVAMEAIRDPIFWANLENLAMIIQPIHEAQKMSESNHATLGKVLPRWQNLQKELLEMIGLVPELEDFIISSDPDFLSPFDSRQNIQTLPIHIVAYFLDPQNLKVVMEDKHRDVFFKWLDTHIPLINQAKTRGAFFAFRTQKDGFNPNDIS
jgi:hypothetical protein